MKNVEKNMLDRLKEEQDLLIYGAGTIGRRLLGFLEKKGLNIVQAFIVEDVINNASAINNIPILDYKKFVDCNNRILIALKDKEVENIVIQKLMKVGVAEKRIILLSEREKEELMDIIDYAFDSAAYWERRYLSGGNSGAGSYNHLAQFKANIINGFVREKDIKTVIEWGCGDGNQLRLANYPKYIGMDVSIKAVEMCKNLFREDITKEFYWCGENDYVNDTVCELAISLDVIYHLVEDKVYELYMKRLFSSSNRYVCIYSSNYDKHKSEHVKHRKFTQWINDNLGNDWIVEEVIKNQYPYMEDDEDNTSEADFYFFKKI